MKILFDLFFAQPIGESKFHGGGEYIKTVFRHLTIENKKENSIDVFLNTDEFIDDWIMNLVRTYDLKIYDVKSIKDVENIFEQERYDIFYTGMPYKYFEISMPSYVRKIGTFHGLRFAEKPTDRYAYLYKTGKEAVKFALKNVFYKYFQEKAERYYQRGITAFDDIITDSEHSKYAIKSMCDVGNRQIHVFYTPAKFVEGEAGNENLCETEKYILIVGGNRWEKNTVRVLLAIEELLQKNKLENYKIKVVGRIPEKLRKRLKHEERYELNGYVESRHLESLYQNCDFFIYASLNEGFGMPPLEAMKYGKTSIVSGVCSLPEICGDVVYYVNPYDIKEIENRILRAVDQKIPCDDIKRHFEQIYSRQKKDLSRICSFIMDCKGR